MEPTRQALESFFEGLRISSLPEQAKGLLEASVTLIEIVDAISSLPNGKAPGPDGLSSEFFKSFQDILSPLLLILFQELVDDPSRKVTFHRAAMVVLPKQDKDTSLC